MAEVINDLSDQEFFGMRLGLEKIQTVLAKLDHPEKKYPTIHIAGTNGKGSTAMMIASLLKAAGQRVGLFTSPHLQVINERFWMEGSFIDDETLGQLATMIDEAESQCDLDEPLTYFEVITAMALQWFADKKVEVAILEVGLGGRLDATNVVTPEVAVITSISSDHTAHLGDSLEEIAGEKAGIIKSGVPVISGVEEPRIKAVIQAVADEKKGLLSFIKAPEVDVDGTFSYHEFNNLNLDLLGDHQRHNACLAIQAAQIFAEKKGVSLTEETIRFGLQSQAWPGRLEFIAEHKTLLDGAHNVAAIEELANFLRKQACSIAVTLVFGTMQDKEVLPMLRKLLPFADRVIVTSPKLERSLDPDSLPPCFPDTTIEVIKDSWQAYQAAQENLPEKGLIVVTGSLFLVGEIRQQLD